MPRVVRVIHEYYENRIVHGLYAQVLNGGDTLRILPGSAVVDEGLIGLGAAVDFLASVFIVNSNKEIRTDILVLDTAGHVQRVAGTPGNVAAPDVPALSILIAQINIAPGWKRFSGTGAFDEVLSIRSQHVIDTRFTP